jgi:TM2 domain-containing membrane protein YozV
MEDLSGFGNLRGLAKYEKEGIRTMSGQGSAGNVLAALASLFIPGLGQLLQGRLGMAVLQFVLAALLWVWLLGWIIHLWSIIDAAKFKAK